MNPYDSLQHDDYLSFLQRGRDTGASGTVVPEAPVDQGFLGLEGGAAGAGGMAGPGATPTEMPSTTLQSLMQGMGLLKQGYGYLQGGKGGVNLGGAKGPSQGSITPGFGVEAPEAGASGWGAMGLSTEQPSNYVEMGPGIDTNWLNNWGSLGGDMGAAGGYGAGLQGGVGGELTGAGGAGGSALGSAGNALSALAAAYNLYGAANAGLDTSAGGNAMLGAVSSLMGLAGAGPVGLGMAAFKALIDGITGPQKARDMERTVNRTKGAGALDNALFGGDAMGGSLESYLSGLMPGSELRRGDVLYDYSEAANKGYSPWGENEFGLLDRLGVAPSQRNDRVSQLLSQLGYGRQGLDYASGTNTHGEVNNLMEYLAYSGLGGTGQKIDFGNYGGQDAWRQLGDVQGFGSMLDVLDQVAGQRGISSAYQPSGGVLERVNKAAEMQRLQDEYNRFREVETQPQRFERWTSGDESGGSMQTDQQAMEAALAAISPYFLGQRRNYRDYMSSQSAF